LKVIHRIHNLDLALLKAPTLKDSYSFLPVTDTRFSEGQTVYTMGYPGGEEQLAYGQVILPRLDNPPQMQCNSFWDFVSAIWNFSASAASLDLGEGAIVSDNQIEEGISGGLLSNESLEVSGVVLRGIHNEGSVRRYLDAVLPYTNRSFDVHSVRSIASSYPIRPIIEYLEKARGININKLRDGEPSGLS